MKKTKDPMHFHFAGHIMQNVNRVCLCSRLCRCRYRACEVFTQTPEDAPKDAPKDTPPQLTREEATKLAKRAHRRAVFHVPHASYTGTHLGLAA